MSEPVHAPKQIEDHHGTRQIEKKGLLLVVILTGTMMIAEGIAGYMTKSLALLSDAFHMLTHFIATGISLVAIYIAMMKAPPEKTYKYWRVEVIAALFNGISLIPIVVFIVLEANKRFTEPVIIQEVPMLIVAVIGLLVNIASAWILMRPSQKDLNVKSAFLHMVVDAISSVGVITGGIIVVLTKSYVADTVIAIGIAALTLYWAVKIIKDSVIILLESAPKNMKVSDVESVIKSTSGVKNVHDVHVWVITSGMYALTAHIELDKDVPISETSKLTHNINHTLDHKFDITHTCFQFELPDKNINQ